MGIIKRQALQSSVLLYIGVIIGFVSTGLLAPNLLQKSEIGTLKLLMSYSAILQSLGLLGFGTVTLRFMPHFYNQTKKNYNGFLGILLIIGVLGSFLTSLITNGIKPSMVENNIDKSPQFAEYFFLIIPLTIFQIFYALFDSYNNALHRTSYGVFLRDFVQRIIVLIGLLLVYMQFFQFEQYVVYYVIAICTPTILILLNILSHKAFDIRIKTGFLKKSLVTSIASVGFFGLLNSFGGIAVLQIDTIMLNAFMNADAVGVYAITFYFGTLVLIPAKALNRIAPPLIAKAFKENDSETIKDIYHKSTGNLYLIGIFLLLGLAVNLDNIFNIIPKTYEEGRYVILIIGLANLVKMGSGSNDSVITYSKYYKMTTFFLVLLLFLITGLNFLFIPLYGITGAALASLGAIFIHNIIKFTFIKIKFGLNPYNYQYLLVALFAFLVFYLISLLPEIENFIIEILVDSLCASFLFYLSIKYLSIAKEADEYARQIISATIELFKSKIK